MTTNETQPESSDRMTCDSNVLSEVMAYIDQNKYEQAVLLFLSVHDPMFEIGTVNKAIIMATLNKIAHICAHQDRPTDAQTLFLKACEIEKAQCTIAW
jgi:hypothetical protein